MIRTLRSALLVPLSAALSALLAAGCSPSLNWREVRPEGADLLAMFPCKPSGPTRRVALAGGEVDMTILACESGGMSFAIGHADVGDPARVGPALDALAAGAAANVGTPAPAASQPLPVAGATPYRESRRLRLAGRAPDGRALEMHVGVFGRGTRVYQATVFGAKPAADAVDTFFAGLRTGG